ncbi:hypothetical protein K7X08_031886 [Anisodus acutangulus]|uniref:Uncharacterized protein n=1 Tax=Anisodus acutangulus TaxID=402998 RepID=A0A9Q1RMJ8_9SOLA|nr:hypothetical protein K7X08_031886 [Anisodus acutangulus]
MDSDTNWSEKVEDLVDGGEISEAISLLEKLVAKLENESQKSSNSQFLVQLSTALLDLSKLYSTQGLSLQADKTRSRAFLIKHRDVNATNEATGDNKDNVILQTDTSQNDEDDDWEAIADRAPDELLSPQHLPEVSKISLQDSKVQGPKRRGRGTFSYQKQSLYSDQQPDGPSIDDIEDETVPHAPEGSSDTKNLNYGTRHVLVLADFPPSTKTNDLEKLLEKFKDDVAIRWINDTVALAVFRTPSLALEASNSIHCPFTVRVLSEEDEFFSSIPPRDLEPPRRRPQTSARTAQRLIAQRSNVSNYTGVFCWPILDEPNKLTVASIDINHDDIADLSNNGFVGKLPDVVVQLPNLKFLDLRFNEFEGGLPRQVFERSFDALFINNNRFSSELPDNFGNSPVSVMVLANNNFEGCIHVSLGKMAKLNELILTNNNFHSCFPNEIGMLKNVTVGCEL